MRLGKAPLVVVESRWQEGECQEAIMIGQRGQQHLDCICEGENPGRKQVQKEMVLWGGEDSVSAVGTHHRA